MDLRLECPRQEVAFSEECRKNKGCGSLREDFYTRFKTNFNGFWVVTWRKMRKKQMFANICSKNIDKHNI